MIKNDAEKIINEKCYPCKFTDSEILILKSAGYQNSDILYLESTGKDFAEIQGERNAKSLELMLKLQHMYYKNILLN